MNIYFKAIFIDLKSFFATSPKQIHQIKCITISLVNIAKFKLTKLRQFKIPKNIEGKTIQRKVTKENIPGICSHY